MYYNQIMFAIVFLLVYTSLLLSCSTPDPIAEPDIGENTVGQSPILEIPKRYTLKQELDSTITLTTTSIGGTFGRLNRKHTCEKGDISPHLKWEGVPDGTKSLALVMEDPASDVHGLAIDVLWTHWVVYSIPPEVTELAAEQVRGELLENGAKQGANDYDLVQYSGPCPIPTLKRSGIERTHGGAPNINAEERPYYFNLYALDKQIELGPGLGRDALLQSIDGSILAAGTFPANYKSVKGISCQAIDAEVCVKTSVKR